LLNARQRIDALLCGLADPAAARTLHHRLGRPPDFVGLRRIRRLRAGAAGGVGRRLAGGHAVGIGTPLRLAVGTGTSPRLAAAL
jgi:hypothetical protein